MNAISFLDLTLKASQWNKLYLVQTNRIELNSTNMEIELILINPNWFEQNRAEFNSYWVNSNTHLSEVESKSFLNKT